MLVVTQQREGFVTEGRKRGETAEDADDQEKPDARPKELPILDQPDHASQEQAAEQLGINPWTVLNWEKGHTEPPIESMPAITWFLGYDPFPEPKNIPERLLAKRRAMGWSIKEAARQVGVDAGTWGAWERGETILFRKRRVLIARLLGLSAKEVLTEMANRWNRSHKKSTCFN